jgi:hypothetical protein
VEAMQQMVGYQFLNLLLDAGKENAQRAAEHDFLGVEQINQVQHPGRQHLGPFVESLLKARRSGGVFRVREPRQAILKRPILRQEGSKALVSREQFERLRRDCFRARAHHHVSEFTRVAVRTFEDVSPLHDCTTEAFGEQDQQHALRGSFTGNGSFGGRECNRVVAHRYRPREFRAGRKQLLERNVTPLEKGSDDDSTAPVYQSRNRYADAVDAFGINTGRRQKAARELGDLFYGLFHVVRVRSQGCVDSVHDAHFQVDQYAGQRKAGFLWSRPLPG